MGLKEARKQRGLTQKEAAKIFGIKYSTYQNYENKVTTPTMETAATFARYFSCTIGELFDLSEGKEEILSDDERHLIKLFRGLTRCGKTSLIASAEGIFSKMARIKDG